jgi:hypothetical protein
VYQGNDDPGFKKLPLTVGDYFGARALLSNCVHIGSIQAKKDLVCIRFDRKGFHDLIKPNLNYMKCMAEEYDKFIKSII